LCQRPPRRSFKGKNRRALIPRAALPFSSLRENPAASRYSWACARDTIPLRYCDSITLGSHSSAHVLLAQTKRERAWEEIEGSRRELEGLIGREIRLFAFPYGDHDPETVKLCKMAGYEQAFTMLPNPVKTESANILRGRVKVHPMDWPIEFFLKFSGAYAWMTWWMKFKHSVLRSC
jgi:peptidoglycan/xylan/chitin deacetylase (PgdA/CDA1 family)